MKRDHILLLVVAIVGCMASSCNKDDEKQRINFTANTNTWYRFSPTTPAPITVGGSNFTTFAYVPGGGTGTATEMGNVTTFFNQLAYTTDATVPQPLPEGSVTASVSMVPNFPVVGAPLPLIQPGDFSGLTAANAWLQVPATDGSGRNINTIIYNAAGDAIFTSYITSSTIVPASATRFNFSGKLAVVGGRGKFANATGEMDFNGFFNPQNPNDAGFNMTGVVEY
jgi:hypothetical protein